MFVGVSDLVEIDACGHRSLNELLIDLDIRLQVWASLATTPRTSWPAPVVAADEAILRLCWMLRAAVKGHYLHVGSDRFAAYKASVERYAATQIAGHARRARASATRDCFRNNLDRARWALRALLITADG
jgi:hypothetical protein